ncbi:hypothetical protein FSST1_008832 [Fusarium sambucinum]
MTSKIVQLLSDQHNPNLYIVDQILSNLGVAGIFALHATCRRLRWLIHHMTESPHLLNINKHLKRFSNNPTRFRYELGKCDGLIAGSFVRNFLTFSSPASARLTIFIDGMKDYNFLRYLAKYEGYGEYTERRQTYLTTHKTHSDVSILIRARSRPIIDIINRAKTSADLMFISWNKFYCLFPLPTIKWHKVFVLGPFDDYMDITLRKYATSGWTTIWPDEAPELVPQGALQQISGQESLIINFGNSPRGKFTPDCVLENGIFSIGWAAQDYDGHPRLAVGTLPMDRDPALRYIHTTGCIGMPQASWIGFLTTKLRHWEYLEIMKMDPDARSDCFFLPNRPVMGNWRDCLTYIQFYMMPTWDYADEHISTWFREWRKQETKLALLPPAPDYRSAVQQTI